MSFLTFDISINLLNEDAIIYYDCNIIAIDFVS